jgi:hypothetical protein
MAVRESDFLLQDRTETINKIENEYGLISQLGIFGFEGITTRTFQFDQVEDGFALIEDRAWGSKRDQVVGKGVVKTHAFPIPHFPFDGHIKPSDVQSRRLPGTDAEFDSMDRAVARELTRIRKSWAQTREWAFREAIVSGAVYAPNGTVSIDYYTELGITQKVVDFELDTATTEVQEKGEEVVGHIQDNLLDGTLVEDIIALCSPEFFASLIRHAKYEEAYKYYNASNGNGDPLRDRLSTMQGKFRTFRGGDGIMYVEYRGSMKGVQLIPANEAYAFPLDASGETFKVIHAPADHVDYVNTEGQEMYAFDYELERGRGHDIETESNFAPFIFKPQAVVKLTA